MSKVVDINTSILHESNQVKNGIEFIDKKISDENSESNLKTFILLNQIYMFTPMKMKSVFGNNLANTKICTIVVSLLTTFKTEPSKNNILSLCLSCLWNATDCSENMGKKLIETENFKFSLCEAFKKCRFNEETDKQVAFSIISIIHNIVRREKMRETFRGFDIESRIAKLAECCDESSIKLVCLMVLLELLTKSELKIYLELYNGVDETVVCYLDGTSNNDDFRSDGFSGKELLDMIKSLCRIDSMKTYFKESATLNSTFMRLLNRNYHVNYITDLIKSIYDIKEIKSILELYITKNKEPNKVIVDGLSIEKSF